MTDTSERGDSALTARPARRFSPQTAARLRPALERSRTPILIADDHRRWVTGNDAACTLLGITQQEIAWRTMDDFTPPSDLRRLEEQWQVFLTNGEAEGAYELYVPDRGPMPLEFSAIAHVLPARHLSVFMPLDEGFAELWETLSAREPRWAPALPPGSRRRLTKREREIMTLVASGGQSTDIAQRLSVSTETVKTHVHNAMGKLGAHTRAHAVAIALLTDQIGGEPPTGPLLAPDRPSYD
jgi:DNA-binding CsgD family transcriptional regulator